MYTAHYMRQQPLGFIDIFRTIISENMEFLHRLQYAPWAALREQSLYFGIVWIYYAMALCGTSPGVCEQEWVIRLPFKAMSVHGLRSIAFEYAWAYVCINHLCQTFFYGILWTFNDTALTLSAQTMPHWTIWQKRWTLMSDLVCFGLAYVAQPLLLLYLSREVGRLDWLDLPGAESAVYTTLIMHSLRIICETIEQYAYHKNFPHLHLTVWTLVGMLLTVWHIHDSSHYMYQNLVGSSWEAAKSYNILGANAAQVLRYRSRLE